MRKLLKAFAALRSGRERRALRLGVAATGTPQPMLRRLKPDLILDVGANRGQFALDVLKAVPHARVVSFEPLPTACDVHRSVFGEDPSVTLVEGAVGSALGTAVLNISGSDDSSSLLEVGDLQNEVFPGTAAIGSVEVPVAPLDDLISLTSDDGEVLLKIDVQGFELEVLKGGTAALRHVRWVYVECSFVELYAQQPLAADIIAFLAERGFGLDEIVGVQRFKGRSVQADLLFIRPGLNG